MTLFPGERFCVLLDNAHNLPLHLAVELGVPVAALLCFAVLAWVWKARPWSETDPARQLAWGSWRWWACTACWSFRSGMARSRSSRCGPWRCFGAGVGWMQPYKSCGACPWVCGRWLRWRVWCSGGAGVAVPPHQPDLHACGAAHAFHARQPLAQVQGSWVFKDAIAFAELTTMPVNRDTAERAHALALRMLQYSPEPRVIERLIESATLLGLDDEAAFHLQRYRVAYPKTMRAGRRRTGRRASRLCLVGRRVGCGPVVIGTSSYRASSGT